MDFPIAHISRYLDIAVPGVKRNNSRRCTGTHIFHYHPGICMTQRLHGSMLKLHLTFLFSNKPSLILLCPANGTRVCFAFPDHVTQYVHSLLAARRLHHPSGVTPGVMTNRTKRFLAGSGGRRGQRHATHVTHFLIRLLDDILTTRTHRPQPHSVECVLYLFDCILINREFMKNEKVVLLRYTDLILHALFYTRPVLAYCYTHVHIAMVVFFDASDQNRYTSRISKDKGVIGFA
jgi:hypothetical protein